MNRASAINLLTRYCAGILRRNTNVAVLMNGDYFIQICAVKICNENGPVGAALAIERPLVGLAEPQRDRAEAFFRSRGEVRPADLPCIFDDGKCGVMAAWSNAIDTAPEAAEAAVDLFDAVFGEPGDYEVRCFEAGVG